MKWFVTLIAMLTLALVGCKGDPIVGTWKIETSSIPNFDKATQDQKDTIGKMRITLNADKTVNTDDGKGKKESGKWDVKDKAITITVNGKDQPGTIGTDGTISVQAPFGTIKLVKA